MSYQGSGALLYALAHSLLYVLMHALVHTSTTGAPECLGRFRRGAPSVFLNETIRADFLIKRLNKKIGGNCLNKHPFCDRWVLMCGTVTIYVSP